MRMARNASYGYVSTGVVKGYRRHTKALLIATAALAGMTGGAHPLFAVNQAWSVSPPGNTFTGNDWTVGTTTPGAANGTIAAGDSLVFGTSNTTLLNNDESTDFTLAGITFNAGASRFSIAGNELDLSSSPIINNSSALQTISTPIVLNAPQTVTTNAGGGNVLLSGNISGTGGITTAGAGTLIVSGVYVYNPANPFGTSFTGNNTFGPGRVVELNSGSALGTGNTNNVASGATLELKNTQGPNLNQFSTTFTGSGTIQKTGCGNFIFGGAGSGGGGNVSVSMSAGSLIDIQSGQLIGSSSGQVQWAANQAAMNIAAGASFEGDEAPIFLDALTGSGTYLGGYGGAVMTTIGVANGSGTFTGRVQNSLDAGGVVSLTKTGTGTEILTGDNTFSGNTIVTGGVLELDNNLALEQSVLNIPAAGTGSIVFGSGVTSTSMFFGGIAGSTNFALQRGANPTSLTLTGSAANSVFTGALVGGTTLTKAGGGIQTLSGANTYTGSTTILEGGLSLDYNANANGGNPIIPSTSSLTMGGTSGFIKNTLSQSYPILQVQGSSTGPITQTFNGLTLNAGSAQIAVRGLNGNTATLAFGAITHNAGSSVVFSNLNDGVTGSQGVITTTAAADAITGILGGWATITGTPVNAVGTQFPTAYATVSGGILVPYTGYTVATTITDGATTFAGGATQNFKFVLTNGANTTEVVTPNGQTTDVNTILEDASSTGRLKIDVGSNSATVPSTGILRFGVDGGILMASSGNARTNLGFSSANPGFVTAGGPNNNTPGTLTFQLNNRVDINSSIIDNGTGAVTVVYNIYANQTPKINTPNTYSGGTYVNSGRLQILTLGAFGTGQVTVGPMAQLYFGNNGESYGNNFFINGNAGTNGFFFDTPSALRFQSNESITGNITLLGDSTIQGGSGTNTISGQITGNYNLQINQNVNGAGPGNITLSNPSNSWGGDTTLRGGSLVLTAAGALPSGTNLTIFNGGSVVVNAMPVGKALSVGTLNFFGTMGKLDLNNNDLIAHSSSLAVINSLLQLGYNYGAWNGSAGIVSTTAASDTSHLTALGVIVNDNGSGTPLYGAGGTIASKFGGAIPVDGDVLVKYTYYGDANLDGTVDGSDYTKIDAAYNADNAAILAGNPQPLTGWQNGDFNYDGLVDGSDYTLIDNAFNTQGAQFATQIAASTDQIFGSTSAVPEPATLGLIGIGAVGLLGRRSRPRSR